MSRAADVTERLQEALEAKERYGAQVEEMSEQLVAAETKATEVEAAKRELDARVRELEAEAGQLEGLRTTWAAPARGAAARPSSRRA